MARRYSRKKAAKKEPDDPQEARVSALNTNQSCASVVRKAPGKEIPDECAAHVWEKVLELGSEIRRFRSDLESYQSEVRRALILQSPKSLWPNSPKKEPNRFPISNRRTARNSSKSAACPEFASFLMSGGGLA